MATPALPWHDDPKTNLTDDAFDRADYARSLGKLITDTYSTEFSTVFGLVGPWGSGKSTLVNFVCAALEEMSPRENLGAKWKIARFTPWATSDSASMLEEFFAALCAVFPDAAGSRLRRTFGRLVAISAPATNLIPVVGEGVATAMDLAAEQLGRQRPWQEVFDTASEELRKQGVPVLMIVEDVDRLQGNELLTLMRVIRLLGRFPGIQYLLAYDDVTLFKALDLQISASPQQGTGQAFMEKIVQFPVAVPALTNTQMLRRLNEGIERAERASGRVSVAAPRVSNLLNVFMAALDTPRAVDRYTAQLGHQFAVLSRDEVDDEDVMILTLVRCSFPTVYASLPGWRRILLSGSARTSYRPTGSQEEPVDLSSLLAGLSPEAASYATTLLRSLFPRLKGGGHSNDDPSSRRVSVESYFDRYFALTITSDDVSDREVEDAVRQTAVGENVKLLTLITSGPKERAFLAVEKARDVDLSDLRPEDRVRLARTILGHVFHLSAETVGIFTSVRDRAKRWVAVLLADLGMAGEVDVMHVVGSADSLAIRLELWRDIRRAVLERADGNSSPSWLDSGSMRLAAQATDAFMANVARRDEAPSDDQSGWMLHFILSYGEVEPLRDRIAASLERGDFTIEDLAARLVTTRQLLGVTNPRVELGDADLGAFRALVPNRSDPWFQLPRVEGLNSFDISWRNRRRYARGRFHQPSDE